MNDWKELAESVEDGTTYVTIETPEGWKCERCPNDFYHTHGTYTFNDETHSNPA